MPEFRFTCARHQQLFFDFVRSRGCSDPETMETIRRRLLAWLSEQYPATVFSDFNAEACIACSLEPHIDRERLREAMIKIVDEAIAGQESERKGTAGA